MHVSMGECTLYPVCVYVCAVCMCFIVFVLVLSYSHNTIHYCQSRAHYLNTIVSDCSIHLLGYQSNYKLQ